MEDIIMKFNTKYDLETIKEYSKFNIYSSLLTEVVSILAVLAIALTVFFDVVIYLKILAIAVCVIWFCVIIFIPEIKAKSAIKSLKISRDSNITVEFKEADIFMITKKRDDIIGTSVIKYDDVYKICDRKDYMYVYLDKNEAIICSKNNMKGNYKKFVSFIKKRVGKKYRE